MAGNNLLRILRAYNDTIANSDEVLEPGQILYNKTYKYLTVGSPKQSGVGDKLNALPVASRELVGFVGDRNGIVAVADKAGEYHLKYVDNCLELLTPDNFDFISAGNSIVSYTSSPNKELKFLDALKLTNGFRGSLEYIGDSDYFTLGSKDNPFYRMYGNVTGGHYFEYGYGDTLYKFRYSDNLADLGVNGYVTFIVDPTTNVVTNILFGTNQILNNKINILDFYMFDCKAGDTVNVDFSSVAVSYNNGDATLMGNVPYTYIRNVDFSTNDIYYNSAVIPSELFKNNDFVEMVKINNGVTSIGADAFTNTSKLKSLYIPETVTDISSVIKTADSTGDYTNCIVQFNGPKPSGFASSSITTPKTYIAKSEYVSGYTAMPGITDVYSGDVIQGIGDSTSYYMNKIYVDTDSTTVIGNQSGDIVTHEELVFNCDAIGNSIPFTGDNTKAFTWDVAAYQPLWVSAGQEVGVSWNCNPAVQFIDPDEAYVKSVRIMVGVVMDSTTLYTNTVTFTAEQIKDLDTTNGFYRYMFPSVNLEQYKDENGYVMLDRINVIFDVVVETYDTIDVPIEVVYGQIPPALSSGSNFVSTVDYIGGYTTGLGNTIESIHVESLDGTKQVLKGNKVAGYNTLIKIKTKTLSGYYMSGNPLIDVWSANLITVKFGDYTV